MSNGRGKIEIIKPFGEAFELMKKILFQPFDFKKWFVIGFAAFLSGHISGVNLPLGNWGSTRTEQAVLSPNFEEWKPWLPIIITVFVAAILILIVLFTWLKARGNFIFTDCIARNRAAIAIFFFCYSWASAQCRSLACWRSVCFFSLCLVTTRAMRR